MAPRRVLNLDAQGALVGIVPDDATQAGTQEE